jgi:hypothetical protein
MAGKRVNISGTPREFSEDDAAQAKTISTINHLPLKNKRIGISVSDSDEFRQLGFSKTHQKDITIELTRYLLVNGAHLVYGGDVRKEGYTSIFSDLSFQYREKESDKEHYTNYFAWPIYNNLNNAEAAEFKKNRVEIKKTDAPKGVRPDLKNKFVPWDNIEDKLLWAKSLAVMRETMTADSHARIFLGGSLSSYKGFYPGIIEEGILTLRKKQPFFLVGAFGGATNMMIRALNGEEPKKLSAEIFQWYPGLTELYDAAGKKQYTANLQDIFNEFKKLKLDGLGKLNGLTTDQNTRLFTTSNVYEIVYSILTGLKHKFKK